MDYSERDEDDDLYEEYWYKQCNCWNPRGFMEEIKMRQIGTEEPQMKVESEEIMMSGTHSLDVLVAAAQESLLGLKGITKEDIEQATRLCNSGGILISGVLAEQRVAECLRDSRQLSGALATTTTLTAQVGELASAIAKLAVACGVISDTQPLTGPQLLLIADDIAQEIARLQKVERISEPLAVEQERNLDTTTAEVLGQQKSGSGDEYVVSESAVAITTHLRRLADSPLKYGGGLSIKALCGSSLAWDTKIPVSMARCRVCRELAGLGKYMKGTPAPPR